MDDIFFRELKLMNKMNHIPTLSSTGKYPKLHEPIYVSKTKLQLKMLHSK